MSSRHSFKPVQAVVVLAAVALVAWSGPSGAQRAVGALRAERDLSAVADLARQLGGSAGAIATDGRIALVGVGPRVVVYNVGGGAPRQIGQSDPLPNAISAIVLGQGVAYVAVWSVGLWILDTSRPEQPSVLGRTITHSAMGSLAVRDGYAYVGDGPGGLRVVDVRDAARPTTVATVAMPDREFEDNETSAYGAVLAGDHVFVRYSDLYSSGNLMAVFDITDPTRPTLGVAVELNELGSPSDFAVAGPTLYEVGQYGLFAVDLSNPLAPRVSGRFDPADYHPTRVAALGDKILLASGPSGDGRRSGLVIVDLSDSEGVELGSLETGRSASGLATAGAAVIVVDAFVNRATEVRRVDAVDLARPRDDGAALSPGAVHEVAVGDDAAFVVAGHELWTVPLPGDAHRGPARFVPPWTPSTVVTDGPVAYVAARLDGVRVLDIADPWDLREVAAFDPDPGSRRRYEALAVASPYLYGISARRGVRGETGVTELIVVDIRDPSRPVEASRLPVAVDAHALAVRGRHLIVLEPRAWRVIDVSRPTAPVVVARVQGGDPLSDVAFDEDGYAFVLAPRQLRVYELSVPEIPLQVAAMTLPALAVDLDVRHGRAVIALHRKSAAEEGHGAAVLELSVRDARDPQVVALTDVPGPTIEGMRRVVIAGDDAYIAAAHMGLMQLHLRGSKSVRLALPFALQPR